MLCYTSEGFCCLSGNLRHLLCNVQIAANFVNDMWRTTLCLQYSAEMLAAGCLYAAAKVTQTEVPLLDGKPWCASFPRLHSELDFNRICRPPIKDGPATEELHLRSQSLHPWLLQLAWCPVPFGPLRGCP